MILSAKKTGKDVCVIGKNIKEKCKQLIFTIALNNKHIKQLQRQSCYPQQTDKVAANANYALPDKDPKLLTATNTNYVFCQAPGAAAFLTNLANSSLSAYYTINI